MTRAPSENISTSRVDSDNDSPQAAREDIKDFVQAVDQFMQSYGDAHGIGVLNSSGKVPASYIALSSLQLEVKRLLFGTTGIGNVGSGVFTYNEQLKKTARALVAGRRYTASQAGQASGSWYCVCNFGGFLSPASIILRTD